VKGDNGDPTATDHHPTSTELEATACKGIPSAEATAAEGSAALAAAAAELPYQVGTILEALDVASKWFAARVVKVDLRKFGNQPRNKRLRIHFIGWGTEWDEWFDLNDPTQPARLRPLSPTTKFGPYFHTVGQVGMWRAGFAGETFRNRMRFVLEAIGNGHQIGFDSLVRAVYEFRSRMRPDDAMKIVRRVAKVLEEWHEQGIVRWTSPIGFVEVINITMSDSSCGSPIPPPISTPHDGNANQTSEEMPVTARDPVAPPPSANTPPVAPTFKVGDAVEVLDGTMEWFMATIVELPTDTHRAPDSNDGNGSPRPNLQVVSVMMSNVGYAKCRFDGWSAEWDIWVPASTASGDLPRVRHKTSAAKKKEHVAAAGGGTLMAAGVEATGADMFDESDELFYSAERVSALSAAAKDVEFSSDQRDATFREVANIVFSSPEVEARMRRMTRQTTKSDVEAIGTTRAEDVPIEVMDTHTIKNLGAFARHDIAEGAFIGEYAGEVTLLSSVRKRKSEYLFNLGSGLTIDASRQGNATRFMNHSSDKYACNVSAMIVNHRGTRRVVFHAKRLIHHGEEMMYDYGEDFAKNIGKRLI
jgi:transcription antitermination factor NusG